jgi:hypothetical protein
MKFFSLLLALLLPFAASQSLLALSEAEKDTLFSRIYEPHAENLPSLEDFVDFYDKSKESLFGKILQLPAIKAYGKNLNIEFKQDSEFDKYFLKLLFGVYVAGSFDLATSYIAQNLITIAHNSNDLYIGDPKRREKIRALADAVLEKLATELSAMKIFSDMKKIHVAIIATSSPLAERETNDWLGISQWLDSAQQQLSAQELSASANKELMITPIYLAKLFKNEDLTKKAAMPKITGVLEDLLSASDRVKLPVAARTVEELAASKHFTGYEKAMARYLVDKFDVKLKNFKSTLKKTDPDLAQRYAL